MFKLKSVDKKFQSKKVSRKSSYCDIWGVGQNVTCKSFGWPPTMRHSKVYLYSISKDLLQLWKNQYFFLTWRCWRCPIYCIFKLNEDSKYSVINATAKEHAVCTSETTWLSNCRGNSLKICKVTSRDQNISSEVRNQLLVSGWRGRSSHLPYKPPWDIFFQKMYGRLFYLDYNVLFEILVINLLGAALGRSFFGSNFQVGRMNEWPHFPLWWGLSSFSFCYHSKKVMTYDFISLIFVINGGNM